MRLPNGFGNITEIKYTNLRNPYRVLVPIGKNDTGHTVYRTLRPKGYFKTYNEAYQALLEYHKNPYSIDKNITMQELFDKWLSEHSKDVSPETVKKNIHEWKFISSLHPLLISQVRTPELKLAFDHLELLDENGNPTPLPRTIKVRVKNVLNQMYDYALSNDLVPQNYARSFSLPREEVKLATTPQTEHVNYTDAEVSIILKEVDLDPIMEILYIQMYSGWRPDELLSMQLADVNLEEGWMRGGSKTDAGINRIVPIHSKIYAYVRRNYQRSAEAGNPYLFAVTPTRGYHKTYYNYHLYYHQFVKARNRLGLNPRHRPHDGRVYFATAAKKAGVDEYALKRMMGHQINDVTESRYVKRDVEWLRQEIEKLK